MVAGWRWCGHRAHHGRVPSVPRSDCPARKALNRGWMWAGLGRATPDACGAAYDCRMITRRQTSGWRGGGWEGGCPAPEGPFCVVLSVSGQPAGCNPAGWRRGAAQPEYKCNIDFFFFFETNECVASEASGVWGRSVLAFGRDRGNERPVPLLHGFLEQVHLPARVDNLGMDEHSGLVASRQLNVGVDLVFVRVFLAPEEVQPVHPCCPQLVSRQHSLDRRLDNFGGVVLVNLLGGGLAKAARESRVLSVQLALPLVAAKLHVLGVDNHDHIAHILPPIIRRLVLSLQDLDNLGG
mmetsp:Transcript_8237/g.24439  ORF Transcript_8237/g.24439 Transcript_8237/m.24439 type:complete len:295 (+) Transcript_8237:1793-2677(+)